MKKHLPRILIGLVIVLGGLLFFFSSRSAARDGFVPGTHVACLPNGHQQIAVHIHPTLSITVDGALETIPANIGLSPNCMAELHTHDATGTIHVETATTDRLVQLSFADFFAVWGVSIEREGYTLSIRVDGQPVASIDDVPLRDKARIELSYSSGDPMGGADKSDLIRLDSPLPNAIVTSPLSIRGEARGNWFFEASFPVFLTDWDGKIIAEGVATAKSEWMTTEFVPFETTLAFTADPDAFSDRGTLILKKDNPSGLPEYDDALEIPVAIK